MGTTTIIPIICSTIVLLTVGLLEGVGAWTVFLHGNAESHKPLPLVSQLPNSLEKEYVEITATVTAFNFVPAQTDNSPCIAASGDYICGRTDVIACPRKYSFGTVVGIDNRTYICLDRTHPRFDNRFDIGMGTDIEAAKQWGKQKKVIRIYQ